VPVLYRIHLFSLLDLAMLSCRMKASVRFDETLRIRAQKSASQPPERDFHLYHRRQYRSWEMADCLTIPKFRHLHFSDESNFFARHIVSA
jgi:hypothetical protein